MEHIPIYKGMHVSLGVMMREYIPLATPALNQLSITRGVLLRPPVSLEAEYEWFDKIKDRSDQLFAILKHEPENTYKYIGHTGLHRVSWPNATATSGTVIIDNGAHKKGFGTEAKLLLLYHGFMVTGLRIVDSSVKAFNGDSLGHLVKCGYKLIGRRKCRHFDNGTYIDEILLEVFRSDFEKIWKTYKETERLPSLTPEQRKIIALELAL